MTSRQPLKVFRVEYDHKHGYSALFWYSNHLVIIACNFLPEKRVLFSESVPLFKQLYQSLLRSYPTNQVILETGKTRCHSKSIFFVMVMWSFNVCAMQNHLVAFGVMTHRVAEDWVQRSPVPFYDYSKVYISQVREKNCLFLEARLLYRTHLEFPPSTVKHSWYKDKLSEWNTDCILLTRYKIRIRLKMRPTYYKLSPMDISFPKD